MQKSILSLMLSLKQCTLFRTIRSILEILRHRSVLCKIYLMSMYRSVTYLSQQDVKKFRYFNKLHCLQKCRFDMFVLSDT